MISPSTIEAVKARIDLVALIGESVRLKKQGRRYSGLCPFHSEKTPSFSVNAERGFYYCFGCKASGSGIDFVMHRDGLSFPEAVRMLADRFGVIVEESGSKEEQQEAQRRRRAKEQLFELNALAASFFEQQLREHPLAELALRELDRRGLAPGSSEQVDRSLVAFRIGYAPYGWDSFSLYLEKNGVSAEAAAKLGLIVPRRGGGGSYDQFRHRLMFAVFDKQGRVVAFSGRALQEPSEEQLRVAQISPTGRRGDERGPPKYVNSPESPIYVKGEHVFGLHQARSAVREHDVAVLVEGNFDVLALHARGFCHAVAPLGTAFTVEQGKLLKRFAPTIVTLFDADAAGKAAAIKLRKPTADAELRVKVAELPADTDPDQFAREKGIEALAKVVAGARDMLEFLIEDTLRNSGTSLRDRQDAIRRVMGFLGEERDPTARSMAKAYADKVSAQLVVDGRSPTDMRALEGMVRRALHTADRGPTSGDNEQTGGGRPSYRLRRTGQERISESVLGALLDFPQLGADPDVEQALQHLSGDPALAAAEVRSAWEAKKCLDVAELLDLLPPSIHHFAVARLASPIFSELAQARRELLENTRKLQQLSLKGDKAIKLEELSRADRLGDSEAQDELLRELAQRSKEKLGLS